MNLTSSQIEVVALMATGMVGREITVSDVNACFYCVDMLQKLQHEDEVIQEPRQESEQTQKKEKKPAEKTKRKSGYEIARKIGTKLTIKDIPKIRELAAFGEPYSEIAKMYNCTLSNIHYVVKRFTWKHVK